MALQRAIRTGGDFLDLKELAAAGPVLCVFRIREFRVAEKATGFEGVNLPVIADCLIASGPSTGQVHLGERFIGGITAVLRGVKNPKTNKGEQPQPPTTVVGAEIVARVKLVNPGKSNAGAVGDEPSDADMAAAELVYTAAGGEGLWDAAAAAAAAAAANGGGVLVGAGAGAPATNGRPW